MQHLKKHAVMQRKNYVVIPNIALFVLSGDIDPDEVPVVLMCCESTAQSHSSTSFV